MTVYSLRISGAADEQQFRRVLARFWQDWRACWSDILDMGVTKLE
jgi:hypothetical protein